MKFASYNDGSRDGQLVVVSRDLTMAHYATSIATRLQQVLDDWNFLSPQLSDLSTALNQGRTRHAFAFDSTKCMAPLPRSHHVVRSAAYGTELQGSPLDPQMVQCSGHALLAAHDGVLVPSEKMGIDFAAGLATITSDVTMGTSAQQALECIRLVMLCNSISLRYIIDLSIAYPYSTFSPVAATPDELGQAWHNGRLCLSIQNTWNSKRVGLCDTAADMHFHFGQLIAHQAQTHSLGAGSIIQSGPACNLDTTRGYACIAQKRALEVAQSGTTKTQFMQHGDTIHIDMKGPDGHSMFGAIDQTISVQQSV
jgi:fumarylacetoacetate (FAA) hydrolase